MDLNALLHAFPGVAVYAVIALVVGVESIGIPVPGETMLIAATLASRSSAADFSPVGIFAAAAAGAIIGDSIGYWVGRELGPRLFAWMTRRFPGHVTPAHIGWAGDLMGRYGMRTVFGGRFVALLRMLAGPLAGSTGMHYPSFLFANATGGIAWAGTMVAAMWYAGAAAEQYLTGFGWVVLGLVVAGIVLGSRRINRAMQENVQQWAEQHPDEMTAWRNSLAKEA